MTRDDELELRFEAPVPGERWISQERSTARSAQGRRATTIRRQVEVLGATASVMTRARVTYLEHPASVVAGRRYRFVAEDGAVAVARDDGTALSAEEAAALEADRRRFGPVDRLGMALAGRRYRMGEPFDVPTAELADPLGGMTPTRMVVMWVDRDERGAVFTLAFEGTTAAGGAVSLTGTARLDPATARVREVRLAGSSGDAEVAVSMVRDGLDA